MSQNKNLKIARKLLLTGGTQFIILVISFFTGIIMPQYMGAAEYGYYQIYLYYLGFLNLFGLGYNDGLALYYGSYQYQDLPFPRLRRANLIFVIYISALCTLLLIAFRFTSSPEYQFIYSALSASLFFICLYCVAVTTLLACGATELYNLSNLLQRGVLLAVFLALMFSGIKRFRLVIIADVFSRAVVMLLVCVIGYRLFIGTRESWGSGFQEIKAKSISGAYIMISAILSSAIPTLGRIIIEKTQSIVDYGIYSFGQSLIGIVVGFVGAFGLVIYPILKRLREEMLSEYYAMFSFLIKIVLYLFFWAYPLIGMLIRNYMPEYQASLSYLPFLLMMSLPMSKIYMLITPYCKAWRLEKKLLHSNVVGMFVVMLITSVFFILFRTISAVAIGSGLSVFLWYAFSEWYCFRKIQKYPLLQTVEELAVSLLYVMLYTFAPTGVAVAAFGVVFLIIMVFQRGKFTLLLHLK